MGLSPGPASAVLRYLRGGCDGCLCGRLCEPCRDAGESGYSEGTVGRVTPERVVLTDGRVFRRPPGGAPRPGQTVVIDPRPGLVWHGQGHVPRAWHVEETPFVPPRVEFAPLRGYGHSMMAGVGAMAAPLVSAWHPNYVGRERIVGKPAPQAVRDTFAAWMPGLSPAAYTPFAVGAVAQGRLVYTLWGAGGVFGTLGNAFSLVLTSWDPVTDATAVVDTLRVPFVAEGGDGPPVGVDGIGASEVFPERYKAFDQFAPLFVGVQGETLYVNQHYSHNVGVYGEYGELVGWETLAVGAYMAQASPGGLTGGWVAGEFHSPLKLGELSQGGPDDPVRTGGVRTMDQGWSGSAAVMEYGVLSSTPTRVVGAQFWQVELDPTGVGLTARARIDQRATEAFNLSSYRTVYDRAFGAPGAAPTAPPVGDPVGTPRPPLVLRRPLQVNPPPPGQTVRLFVQDSSELRFGDLLTIGGAEQRVSGVGERAVELWVESALDLPAGTELPVTRYRITVVGTGRAYGVRLAADSVTTRLFPTAASGWAGTLLPPVDPDLPHAALRRSALRGQAREPLTLTFPALPDGWEWGEVVLCLTLRMRQREGFLSIYGPLSDGIHSNGAYYQAPSDPRGWSRQDKLTPTGRHWQQVRLPLILPLVLPGAWTLTLEASQPLDLSSAVVEASGVV